MPNFLRRKALAIAEGVLLVLTFVVILNDLIWSRRDVKKILASPNRDEPMWQSLTHDAWTIGSLLVLLGCLFVVDMIRRRQRRRRAAEEWIDLS